MSLSNPTNPPIVNEHIATRVSTGAVFSVDENQSKINQLHGINPAGSTGAGIPKPVFNVAASIANASLGATNTINIQFQRDPSDKNFAGVTIYVKGYQGNNAPVQVGASKDSPCTVILNNTGESVILIVQTVGNGGVSPIATSPTCAIKLPNSVIGGAGATAITSATALGQMSGTLDNVKDGTSYAKPIISRINAGKPLIDFSESIHLNKILDNIADGLTYARPLASRVSSGKPLIDFSEAIHLNKNVDNVSDGVVYGRIPQLGGNLLPDSGFELGTTYWPLPSGFALVQGAGLNGSNAIQVQWNAGFMTSKAVTVTAGTSYVLSAYLDQTNITCPAGQRSFIMQVNFFNNVGTLLQQSFVNFDLTNDPIGSAFATGLTVYKYSTYAARIGMTCTAPAGAVTAKVLTPQGGTASTSGTQLYSAPQFEVGTSPSPYRQRIGDGITGYLLPGAAAIDLASSIHVNKILDNVGDGTTYARPLSSRISSGKPLIDFSEAIHLNKNIDNVGDGTTFKRLANVNADNTLHVSTPIIKQGSIAAAGANNFSYTSTTTSITWSWGAFSVYGPDGTTYNFSSGSATAFTGLTASTTYHFGLYVTLATLTVHVALSTQTSGKAKETQSIIVQTFNGDGNVAINVDAQAATPASGSGGGGGGGASCFSPNTKVKTHRGDIRFDSLRPDDEVLTAKGTWRRVLAVVHRPYKGQMLAMGSCEFVTPSHLFLTEDGWKPSADVYPDWPRVEYDGSIWNAIIDADDDWTGPETEHSYTLVNGIVAHNPIT